tara:strand:+ start:527 stop:727 length:201 start_codon:yes stop_codon:yes gene_type:complete
MLPAQRQSHGRSRRRRSHDALKPIKLVNCPLMGEAKRPHRVSPDSGYVRAGLRISVPKLGIGTDRV